MRHETKIKPIQLAELASVVFMAIVVAAANGLQLFYILFPELGALCSDVLLRPSGKWAKEPLKLIATPTIAAVGGIVVGRWLPYGVVSILAAMTLGMATVFILRSAVAPAISAGVFPIVFGLTSWLYPLCIFCSLSILAGALLVWRRSAVGQNLIENQGIDQRAVEVLESPPHGKWWFFAAIYIFVLIVGFVAQVTAWRFILFPPLIVMAYEMLGHPETCPWAKRPFPFPAVCCLAALAGVQAEKSLGVNPIAAAIVMAATYLVMNGFRLRMPPALAVGLIPFVMKSPSYWYAVSVGLGTTALTVYFLVYRRLLILHRRRAMRKS